MSALSHTGFRAYFFAAIPLVQALWAQRVTIGWLAWEASGSAAFVGFIAALGLIPMLVSGPVFGVLVDRADIRTALTITSGSMAALLAVAALLAGGPGLGQVGLAVVALAIGIVTSAHHPVRMSLGPRLVARDDVPQAVALSALNFNLARLLAPVLTGLALATVGAVATLWVSALLYMPMLFAIRFMNPRDVPAANADDTLLAGLRAAFAYLLTHNLARQSMILTILMAILVRGALELLPVMAEAVHNRGAPGLGLLTAAAGAGALVAALGKTVGIGVRGVGIPVLVRVVLLVGVLSLAALGLASSWAAALFWTAVLGFSSTFCGVSLQAIVQSDLPDAMRGRVMSLWVAGGIGAVAIGSGILGWVAGLTGLPPTLVWAGALGAVAAIPLALSSGASRAT